MRFTTRDLLWIMTGASVYAAVVGTYASYDGLSFTPALLLNSFSLFACFYLVRAVVVRGGLRGVRLVVRRYFAARTHAALFLVFGLLPLLAAFAGMRRFDVSLLAVAAVLHCAVEAAGSVVFAEQGVFLGKLHDWDAWRFELRPDTAKLVRRQEPNVNRLAPHVIAIQRDRLEEVAAVLAEKQPTAHAQLTNSTNPSE